MELHSISTQYSLEETARSEKDRGLFVFGEIEFEDLRSAHRNGVDNPDAVITPKSKSYFVKVEPDCDVGELIEEMKSKWDLDHPNLLMSVMGGAWDFPVNDGVREVLRSGIVKATVGTKAWILTNGINVGVSKYVAAAVKHSKLVSKYLRKKPTAVVTIGIELLSNVRTNQRVKLKSIRRATLTSNETDTQAETKGHRVLDPNHTHFILVDDTGDQTDDSPAKPLHDIRHNFEEAMNKYGPVPVVCIYIEGGHHTIQHACTAVENGIPVVVVNHSGRAANLMALAHKSDGLKWQNDKLEYKLRRITPREEVDTVLRQIQSSLSEHSKRVRWHVYDWSHSTIEIDQVILKALMQANRDDSHRQLGLAQTWNRHDIVRTQLFASMRETMEWEDYHAEQEYFQERLMSAIVSNKPGFVRLYLGNGAVAIETYLTRRVLTQLYFEVKKSPLKKILRKKHWYTQVKSTLMPCCDDEHSTDEDSSQGYMGLKRIGDIIQLLTSSNVNPYKTITEGITERMRNPLHHLFLFAVLNGFHEMAEYFWEEGNEHIATALLAREIYLGMAARHEGDKQTELENMAKKYEDLSCAILEHCRKDGHDFRKHDVSKLLIRELPPFFGANTCLKLAESTESRQFIAHHTVQSLLNEIWRHGLPEERDHESKSARIKRTLPQKIVRLWRSPRTTFVINVVSQVLFLCLFSYLLLIDAFAFPEVSWWEVLLIFWVGTIVVEELRQVFHDFLNKKLSDYVANYWNKIDILMLSTFGLAMLFRFLDVTNEIGRYLMAIDLFLFFFRQLHVFTISEQLGPKVIMVFKMFVDLMLFLSILFIILLGYGIAVHAIQFPRDTDPVSLVSGILYRPYFQIYGELFLEGRSVLDPDDSCSTNQTEIEQGADRCPEHGHFAIISLGLYMMISNVLLLNLLIATFSNTFETVQEETDLHWKFHSYALTKEFYQRPDLMPPFIIIADVYRFIIWILRKIGVYQSCRFEWNPAKIQRKYRPEEDERLVKLAELAANKYISQTRRLGRKDACTCCQFTEMSKRRLFDRLNEFDHIGRDEVNGKIQMPAQSIQVQKSTQWSEDRITVELECDESESHGFGFSVKESKILIDSTQDLQTANVIGSLLQNGVAKQDGQIATGDKIVSINGIDVEQSPREFVVQVLKKAGNNVRLEVMKLRDEDTDEIFV